MEIADSSRNLSLRPTQVLDQDFALGHDILLVAQEGSTVGDALSVGRVKETNAVVILHSDLARYCFLDIIDLGVIRYIHRGRKLPERLLGRY